MEYFEWYNSDMSFALCGANIQNTQLNSKKETYKLKLSYRNKNSRSIRQFEIINVHNCHCIRNYSKCQCKKFCTLFSIKKMSLYIIKMMLPCKLNILDTSDKFLFTANEKKK